MSATLTALDGEPIVGLAELVESRPNDDAQKLAALLKERASDVGLGNPAARSTSKFAEIVDLIRNRSLVEDYGIREFNVDWFDFHVPPGAKGRLKVTHKKKGTTGVSLKVLGLGFGGGRSMSIALEDDFGERTECLRLRRTFAARFRVYEDWTASRYVQVDVERVVKDEQLGTGPCDRCGIGVLPESGILPLPDTAIDVTKDPKGRTLSEKISIEENKELDLSLPIKLPGLDVTPGVTIKRNVELECDYGFTLPGGYCYTPFREAGGWKGFPFWLRT